MRARGGIIGEEKKSKKVCDPKISEILREEVNIKNKTRKKGVWGKTKTFSANRISISKRSRCPFGSHRKLSNP